MQLDNPKHMYKQVVMKIITCLQRSKPLVNLPSASSFSKKNDDGLVNPKRVDKKIKFIKTVPDRLLHPSSPFQ